jgi:two-component system, sensor histidine kinase and response regulator
MQKPILVVIEDSETDAFIIQKKLKEFLGDKLDIIHFPEMKPAQKYICDHKDDIAIILMDLGLPDTSGRMDTFTHLKQYSRDIPIIVLTDLDDHDLAVELVKGGADTFLKKELLAEKPELLRESMDFARVRHQHAVELNKEKDMVISWMSGSYSLSN